MQAKHIVANVFIQSELGSSVLYF